jgi:hypothetical protein
MFVWCSGKTKFDFSSSIPSYWNSVDIDNWQHCQIDHSSLCIHISLYSDPFELWFQNFNVLEVLFIWKVISMSECCYNQQWTYRSWMTKNSCMTKLYVGQMYSYFLTQKINILGALVYTRLGVKLYNVSINWFNNICWEPFLPWEQHWSMEMQHGINSADPVGQYLQNSGIDGECWN